MWKNGAGKKGINAYKIRKLSKSFSSCWEGILVRKLWGSMENWRWCESGTHARYFLFAKCTKNVNIPPIFMCIIDKIHSEHVLILTVLVHLMAVAPGRLFYDIILISLWYCSFLMVFKMFSIWNKIFSKRKHIVSAINNFISSVKNIFSTSNYIISAVK